MRHPQSTAFEYPEFEDAADELADLQPEIVPTFTAKELERVRAVLLFLEELVFTPNGGAANGGPQLSARGMRARWCVVARLLGVRQGRTLEEDARRIGCTRAWLSMVGKQVSRRLGIRGSWQRSDAVSAIYAERARGVHAGTWQASDHWNRRKLRLARAAALQVRSPRSAQVGPAQPPGV